MKTLMSLTLILMWLTLGLAATACSDTGRDYYENENHGGYPGPGTRTQNRT